MTTYAPTEGGLFNGNPLNEFSGCHEGIINNFNKLQGLLNLIRETPEDPEIKVIARNLIKFFKEVVLEHHAEEEQELFSAVMEFAEESDATDLAREYIQRLVAEHRELEAMWKQLVPDIKRLSKGKLADIDYQLAEKLATQYLAHAEFEEQYFLPLAAKVLSKQDLSALGLSLHMRHQDTSSNFYI